ncbi:deoxyribonuclease-2-alpha-like [Thunnus thynnus]|uniref:deoxyribonuclease-2-alpha-like n=1 Tax=Thunnus thynnus TaxID=8237 RepID=UPI0035272E76
MGRSECISAEPQAWVAEVQREVNRAEVQETVWGALSIALIQREKKIKFLSGLKLKQKSQGVMWRLVLTVSLLCCSSEARVTCKNENNNEVDWYILYKAPKQNTLTGLEYLYIDSAGVRKMAPLTPPASPVGSGPSATASLAPTSKPINHHEGVLANTLRPLFTPIRRMPRDFGFISYSDQPPGCNAEQEFGHSKGVVMVDKSNTGVWLLHSTPNFPFRRDQNHFWPKSGGKYAQTFMCVTFKYDQFRYIGTHLQYIGAFPFQYDIPEDFHQELKDAVNWIQRPPLDNFLTLTSNGGQPFNAVAKKKAEEAIDGDLYVHIAKLVGGDLDVQTWGCQPNRDKSYCVLGEFEVINVKTITTALGEWGPKKDHSKWCVAIDQNRHWTCIADVNRAKSQYKRGGGALCIDSDVIRGLFFKFARENEECPPENNMDFMDIMDPECDPDPHSAAQTDSH